MNSSKSFLAAGVIAGPIVVILLTGCGKPSVITNPDIKPTKAVLGNPSTMKFRGKPALGAPGLVPGQAINTNNK